MVGGESSRKPRRDQRVQQEGRSTDSIGQRSADQTGGYTGLLDRRRGRPSPRRAPFSEVQRFLQLYRERYAGFNARHFHQIARRDHSITLSYTYVKAALQKAGERESQRRDKQR
jgi:hypothetical protein